MNEQRINAVADALAAIGYDGITAFDRTEPEYDTLTYLYDRYDSEAHVKLLGLLAASQDYQLNGDGQQFWQALEDTATNFEHLNSTQAVRDLLGEFVEADVNARLNEQKRDRLVRVLQAGFDEWFVANHASVTPLEVWERFADDMQTRMESKTVVLAMKIYDIAHLIRHDTYLEFPREIPIPCDLQVERVSTSAGITDSTDTDTVLDAWAAVMEVTSDQLGRHVSLLRIDSIIWQAGQIIGKHEPDQQAAQEALQQHFQTVGLDSEPATNLAQELTLLLESA
ncbi:N-glycosylase/DNA lyase [Haloarcula sp. S1AR25-5A]|uniref:N-glycosylase/DNA lyase n=1 Tax=Haloarcula terrestris TaxID=2950533 RepID=A0AAE4F2R7_9EURY|nr:N-glycosylase/DNA lyase [Haloarcula terrestris]MDS0223468.1 N-glycosylase/DNA lyase [Haloarcula terrestris]